MRARRIDRARRRTALSRPTGILLALATVVGLCVAVAAPAAAAPKPPNPSDAQLARAAAAKIQAGKDVGRLSAQVASIEAQIAQLNSVAEAKEQAYIKALYDLQTAKAAATKAQSDQLAARKAVSVAQTKFRQYIVVSYRQAGTTSDLLTAADPNALLARGDLAAFTAARNLTAISDLTQANVRKTNADSAAKIAVNKQTSATAAANQAKKDAEQAVSNAKSQQVVLVAQKASYESQLQAAGMALTGLQNKRAAFLAWQAAERARLAAIARANAIRAAALARQQAAAAAAAAAQAAATASNNPAAVAAVIVPTGNGSCDTFGGSALNADQTSNPGAWSPAKGAAAVARALACVGKPYAWDGGSLVGPTYGACDAADGAANDCNVIGFDCSGLVMYGWGPQGIVLSHYAPTQYYSGNVHPDAGSLLPGDLIFYSNDGSVGGIHHVVMYIGGGQIVEAPYSGAYVHVTSLYYDGSWLATRPMS